MEYEQHERDRERASCPTDDEMLAELDGYGHLSWTVGDEDWIACLDFNVVAHPERGILVAYHVVVDCESGGFTDTPESRVVEAEKAPRDLVLYWASIAQHNGTTCDDADVKATNKRWNEALAEALAEAGWHADARSLAKLQG